MAAKRRLVLTFDAFGTLFRPKRPVHEQYADLARKHGLSGFTDEEVGHNFKLAFKHAQYQFPNYGKKVGMGAAKWWANVIQGTFAPVLRSEKLPEGLVTDLLQRFSSSEGYELFPDAKALKDLRIPPPDIDVSTGIITNSDDRVPDILTSLGVKVGPHRYGLPTEGHHVQDNESYDVDFVILSYDVGHEKPDGQMFDAAKQVADAIVSRDQLDIEYVHVGDEWGKDYTAAKAAGWKAIYLGGHGRPGKRGEVEDADFIEDLRDLKPAISER